MDCFSLSLPHLFELLLFPIHQGRDWDVRLHICADEGFPAPSLHACRQAAAEIGGFFAIFHWNAYVQAHACQS